MSKCWKNSRTSGLAYFLYILGYFCCRIDYSRETDDKIITFELWFMRCGNFFGRERECDLGMGREWEWNSTILEMGMGMGIARWEWEGTGIKNTFPNTSTRSIVLYPTLKTVTPPVIPTLSWVWVWKLLPPKFRPPPISVLWLYAWFGLNKLIFSSGRHFYLSPLAVQKVTTPLCASSIIGPWSRCLHWRRHVYKDPRHCRCQIVFCDFRQIRSVRRSLPRHAFLTLVRALVVSKVDYCNSVLAALHLVIEPSK